MAGIGSALYWPELYGFYIFGNGPTYVIYVEPSSVSDQAGIHAGDRIVEIDHQDVSKLSANIIKYMARNSKQNPPPISVQSAQKTLLLTPERKSKSINMFGFSVRGQSLMNDKLVNNIPVTVDQIVESSQAYEAGLRPGDLIIQANDKRVNSSDSIMSFLYLNKRLSIKYISMSRHNDSNYSFSNDSFKPTKSNLERSSSKQEANPVNITDFKIERAKKFYAIVSVYFIKF
jgi:S1-C subfamily serine protease